MPTRDTVALRIPEVARILGCTELAARRMIDRGEVPARRWGRRVVVLRDELEAHLRALPPTREAMVRRSSTTPAADRGVE